MIVTKKKLLEMCLDGKFKDPRLLKKIRIFGLVLNELLFIKMIKKDYNWDIEPIRKNTYLIH